MIIYEVEIETDDYYTEEYQLGIYTDLEYAKAQAEKESQYLQKLRVYVLELQDKEFVKVATWELDKNSNNPKWEIVTDS